MAPLPTPGGDNNVWGTILNNYLLVAHQADGTQNAEDVVNVPTAPITSTDVQAAINELATITATPGFYPTRTESADYNATDTDQVILVDATGAIRTVFLPTPVGREGKVYTVRKIDASTNKVRVNVAAGTPLIDGIDYALNRFELAARWETITIVSDGTNWQRLDKWTQSLYGQNPENQNQGHAWVSQQYGNDLNTGYQPWEAKKTIQAAIDDTVAAIIHIDKGTYTETVTLEANQQLWGSGRATTVIRPAAFSDDTIVCNTGCVIQDMTLQGFASTGTGKILNGDSAALMLAQRITITGATLPFVGHAGGADPGYGNTGIYITNIEGAVFDDISIEQCKIGIDVEGVTFGVSHCAFKQIYLTGCWKEVYVHGNSVGGLRFDNIKTGSNNYGVSRDHGYIWDLNVRGSTFIDVVASEGNLNNIRFTFSPTQDAYGLGNTFINCEFAPESQVFIESDRNKFINPYVLNEINILGNENEIDGLINAGAKWFIYGDGNSIRRHYSSANANSQVFVRDYGNGTYVDNARRGGGPPGDGYGFRTGDIIANDSMTAGADMGWICTVAALGAGDALRGTWLNLPDGTAAPLGGKSIQTGTITLGVSGVAS